MTTEQLQIVMQTLQGIGEGSVTAFIAYLSFQALPKILGLGVAAFAVHAIKTTVLACVRPNRSRDA